MEGKEVTFGDMACCHDDAPDAVKQTSYDSEDLDVEIDAGNYLWLGPSGMLFIKPAVTVAALDCLFLEGIKWANRRRMFRVAEANSIIGTFEKLIGT